MENLSRRYRLIGLLAVTLGLSAGDGFSASVFGSVAEPPQYIPIQGAWVLLRHVATKGADSLQTDSAGAYRFSDVTGCEAGCDIEVRAGGYWSYQSDFFQLAAEVNKQVDVALERIHALTVRAFKAEDTAQAVLTAQAILFPATSEAPHCLMADSAGRMQFKNLQSFTGYLLTVSAPGRKATSNMLHFHDPVSNGFFRVLLDSDVAATDKSLHGNLSVKGRSQPAVGEQVILSCRNDHVAADLFAITGADGGYAIAGVPSVCDSVTVYAGRDTAAVGLPNADNSFDWSADLPVPDLVRPGRAPRAGARSPQPLWRGYDLVGRKLYPFHPPSRPD